MVTTQTKPVKVYVVEEQEIYRQLYQTVLADRTPIELIDVVPPQDITDVSRAITENHPDVLLISTKKVSPNFSLELEQLRTTYPHLAVALFLLFYEQQDIRPLRKIALTGSGGMALFLKQSLDFADQLYSIILAVSQGQVILDPRLTTLLLTDKTECSFLKQLTPREMEILNLLAEGYTNTQIADALFIDRKTVEHHLNNMYSKLRTMGDTGQRHLRVSAAKLYLEATGRLPSSATPERAFAPAQAR